MTSEMGLRERKKLATRAALSRAAWSLMVERGMEAVTPEAVADTVGVSPRTFRNYFSSREQAIADEVVQRSTTVVEALRTRPAEEPMWDSLMQVLPDTITELAGERDDVVALRRVCQEDPAMLAQHLAAFDRLVRLLVEAIAERTGTDAERGLEPRLLAAAVGVALSTSTELWADGDAQTTLPDLVRESLAQLRAGLPLGAAAPTI